MISNVGTPNWQSNYPQPGTGQNMSPTADVPALTRAQVDEFRRRENPPIHGYLGLDRSPLAVVQKPRVPITSMVLLGISSLGLGILTVVLWRRYLQSKQAPAAESKKEPPLTKL